MLESITAREAREWELFSGENPIPEEQIIIQLAMIARVFASSFIKRKDRKNWSLEDFIPDFKKKESKYTKEPVKNLNTKLIGIVDQVGDEKAKRWAKKRIKSQYDYDKTMVKGTDGKMYKYALEEFVKDRNELPKRLRGK